MNPVFEFLNHLPDRLRELSDLRHFRRTAEGTSPRHAVMVHMTLGMGLRVSEACSISVEQALNVEQGIRVLRYIGKGSKPAATAVPYQAVVHFDAAIAGRTTPVAVGEELPGTG